MPDAIVHRETEASEAATGRVGIVHQVSVSNGGVPKLAVPEVEITTNGVSGDRQRDRRVHGGPERAVCLFSLDVIERLRAEGHPIAPGTAGENLTVSGLDWSLVRPGASLRVGETVLLEITRYTAPCTNITASFSDGDFNRINPRLFRDESRVYARVLTPGLVRPGDRIEITPA